VTTVKKSTSAKAAAISFVPLLLLAANLRPALTSVGPLLDQIRQATGISLSAAGLLGSLPLIALGALAPLGHLGRRFGIEQTLLGALALLAVGLLIRSQGSVAGLFGGSLCLSAGIAIGNVLVPSLIKRDFPERVQSLTTLYVVTMGVTASIASGIAVPLSALLPGGWRSSLAVWLLPVLVAMAAWIPAARRRAASVASDEGVDIGSPVWKAPVAWLVTGFMGSQSFFFYVVVSWFPTIFQDRGFTPAEAGWLVTLFQLVALGSSMLLPAVLKRVRDQSTVAFWVSAILAISALGLALFPGQAYFWTALMGLGGGACLILALVFIGTRSANHRQTAALSIMAQSLGYLFAATGPSLFGLMHDLTGSWTAPLLSLVFLGAAQAFFGLRVGRRMLP